MKRITYTIIAMCVLTISIPPAMVSANKQIVDTAHIELTKPIDITVFMNVVADKNFDQMILESSFIFNEREINDFKIIKESNKNVDIITDYIQDRKSLIIDTEGATVFSTKNNDQIKIIKIHSVTFTGTKEDIQSVQKELNIQKVDTIDETELRQKQLLDKQNGEKKTWRIMNFFATVASAVSTQTHPMYQYLPISGTSRIKDSSTPGERYSVQFMNWDNNHFGSDNTYEHKIYLYNYDNETFLNGASMAYPGCWPTLTYAASTWGADAKPYIDTRLDEGLTSCEVDELSYTIGAAHADEIATGVTHYTYMRTTLGNATSNKFKLQSQVGYRSPESCDTTWCAAKYKIYNIISAWSTEVSGSEDWTFDGIAPQEAPSDLTITDETSSSLKLNFSDNTYDEATIRIERRVAGGIYSELGNFSLLEYAKDWNWTNTGLQPNTIYCYKLRAKNDIGYSEYSDSVCGMTQ